MRSRSRPPHHPGGLRYAAAAVILSLTVAGCSDARPTVDDPPVIWHPPEVVGTEPLRAFTDDSWWNLPLPDDAPTHPREINVLRYMRTAQEAGDGCLKLAGGEDNSWGQPVYWSQPGDPTYDIEVEVADDLPELRDLRIPPGARPATNDDGSMTIFDLDRGYAVAFTEAVYDPDADSWSAAGATVTYLNSNGLHDETGQSSDDRNLGSHRGNNPAVMMVRRDEVEAGAIRHVLKVATGPEASRRFVFPMVGSDGASMREDAPPQGLRFRIKTAVDLDAMDLEPEALIIARALQDYGFYIGDSGGATALKLEDTRTEGRGQLWSLPTTALCALPFTPRFWDVLPEGYQPPAPG